MNVETGMNDMDYMDDSFYTLVPEQGLCLIGEVIINLRKVVMIRKLDGKTLVYYSGAGEPIILPAKSFEQIRDAVFSEDMDDEDDFEDDFEDDEDEV